jgi:preprotein translocase subunit SecF
MRVYNFMKYKNIWFSISGLVLALGLVFLIINGGLNYGIDFTGGSSITIDFEKQYDIEKVRDVMSKFDENAIVTYAGNDKELAVIKTNVGLDVQKQGELKKAFKENLGIEETNIQIEFIGPSIGKELMKKAIIALILANLGILLYVTIRFEWKLGLSALVALLHDVLIMISAYAIFQIPATSSFLAALLTIIGYSINDTIVIFDRIRENKKSSKKMTDDELVNVSTSQSLTRTINTFGTSFVTIMALYIFGVPAIRDFAFPMIIGMISGVYSTVFIASPVWVMLRKRAKLASNH